jgi:rod shape-determining protein MreC
VILETTRIRGILRGNSAGQPQIVGLLADQRIQKGEKVLTAGGDLIFPRGLPVGVVDNVKPDPDHDSFIDVIITPAAHLDRLDEVLVITSTLSQFSTQQQQDIAASEALKGPEVQAIQDQKKASEIMAERLPGLTDPDAQAQPNAANGSAAKPGQTPANPAAPATPAPAKVLHPAHPDRFSPGGASPASTGQPAPQPKAAKPPAPTPPQRNP